MTIFNTLKSRWVAATRRRALLDEAQRSSRHRRQGIIGVILVGALLAGTGLAVVRPTGKTTYTVLLRNSAGLKSGDDVRIAGIAVGSVSTVRIERTFVKAEFTVDKSVLVGTDSTVEVKLLTPLGGHYIALTPVGDFPLGKKAIPTERTTLPFEINELFQKFTPIVKKVDGDMVRDTFHEVTEAARRNPDDLKVLFDSMRVLTRELSETSPEWQTNMKFVNEYTRTLSNSSQQIAALIDQLARLGKILVPNRVDIIEVFGLISELARFFHRLVMAYDRDYRPIVDGLDDIFDVVFTYPERLGKAAEYLGQLNNIVGPMLSGNGITLDESDRVIPGQDFCLPHLFKQC